MQVLDDIRNFQSTLLTDLSNTTAEEANTSLQKYLDEAIEQVVKPAKLLVLEALFLKGVADSKKLSGKELEKLSAVLLGLANFVA